LSFIKLPIFSRPQGGSVTVLSLFPLCLYAYLFGLRKGFILGSLYGILHLLTGAYVVHPVQLLLDYVMGFSAVAFCALPSLVFRHGKKSEREQNREIGTEPDGDGKAAAEKCGLMFYLDMKHYNLAIGIVIFAIMRFMAHFLSGVIFWGQYAPTQSPIGIIVYSAVYNAPYVFVDAGIIFVVVLNMIFTGSLKYIIKMMKR
jgi:thiamine transporter